jgi:OmpA-like transmembrane domain
MNPKVPRGPATTALLVLVTVVGMPLTARAQSWIVGVSAGAARQEDYAIGSAVTTRDDSDAAARLFGGYRVTANQGVIASYLDLGTPTYEGPAAGGFKDELDANGIDVSYFYGWTPGDQQRASLFATVGLMRWNQDVTYTDGSGKAEYNDDGTSFTLGLGTEIKFGASGAGPWAFHVQYQLFKNVGDPENSGHEYDREMVSLGIGYRFGRERKGAD